MNCESVKIVAEKEYKEMFTNKGLLISLVVLVLVFGWDAGVSTGGSSPFPFDSRALYLSLFIGTFTGFMLAGTVFFREKQSGVIETVMATPLNLREIWLGKVIGISLPAYGMSLLSLAVMTIFAVRSSSSISGPSMIIIFHIVVVTPLFIMAAVGLLGYVQLAMGMKENRILTIVIYVILFAGLALMSVINITDQTTFLYIVTLLLAISLAMLGISFMLSKRLSKEKIITSIPE